MHMLSVSSCPSTLRNVSHWKTSQRDSKSLLLLEAWDLYLLISKEETLLLPASKEERRWIQLRELNDFSCCVVFTLVTFFISVTRLKAIEKVPTFISIHPANSKLLRSSLGIYYIPVLSTCMGCCFDLSVAVRTFRKTLQS